MLKKKEKNTSLCFALAAALMIVSDTSVKAFTFSFPRGLTQRMEL